jgi:hypothetical protein
MTNKTKYQLYGKVLNRATRWQPILPHDAFLGGGAAVMLPCYPRRPNEIFGMDTGRRRSS